MMLQPVAVAPFRHMPSGRLVHTLHGHRPALPDLKSMADNEAALAAKLEGCHNVFIDAGANIGMHARFLFEPQAYPDSTFVSVFDKYFGAADQRGKTTCAIEFEPNPMHAARHEKLSAAYAKVGWRVVFAPYAVSDAAGQLTFFDNDGGDNEDWGFGETNVHDANTTFNVNTIDLPRFVELLSEGKPIEKEGETTPSGVHERHVVIKMDIESAEYAVLPPMVGRGSLCRFVDYIAAEFHSRFAKESPIVFEGRELGSFTEDQANALQKTLTGMVIDNADSCRIKTLGDEDDETYLHDIDEKQRDDPQPHVMANA